MKISNSLKEYGLSDTESKLYFELLNSGISTILELSKKTRSNRATVHVNIASLIKLQLVTEITKGNKRYVQAEPPEKLEYLLEKENWDIKRKEDGLNDLVTSIYDMVDNVKENTSSQVKYYEGKKAVGRLYDEILKSKQIYSWVNSGKVLAIFPENTRKFHDAVKNGVEIWDIQEEVNVGTKFHEPIKHFNNYHVAFVPQEIKITSIDYLIYDKGIAMVQLGTKPFAVSIQNNVLRENAKTMYRLVWLFVTKS